MHRAAFADEPGPEGLQDAVGLHENAPEPEGVFAVIRSVHFVAVERNRVGHLVRLGADVHLKVEAGHLLHDPRVERRDRLRLQRHARRPPIARLNRQRVPDEIEFNLEASAPIRDR